MKKNVHFLSPIPLFSPEVLATEAGNTSFQNARRQIVEGLGRMTPLFSVTSGILYFPNAGYIFGGNSDKGGDCSWITQGLFNTGIRPSTADYVMAWKTQQFGPIIKELLSKFTEALTAGNPALFTAIKEGTTPPAQLICSYVSESLGDDYETWGKTSTSILSSLFEPISRYLC